MSWAGIMSLAAIEGVLEEPIHSGATGAGEHAFTFTVRVLSQKRQPEFFRVAAYGPLAEKAESIPMGSPVSVIGTLRSRYITSHDTGRRTLSTEIVARVIE